MTPLLSPLAADVIGMVGTALFIGGFAYANARADFDRLWFNIVNLAGALLLLISLSVNFNLPAFVLEAAWAMIASWGIWKVLRERARQPLPSKGGVGVGESDDSPPLSPTPGPSLGREGGK
jgi:hypothetical protein